MYINGTSNESLMLEFKAISNPWAADFVKWTFRVNLGQSTFFGYQNDKNKNKMLSYTANC